MLMNRSPRAQRCRETLESHVTALCYLWEQNDSVFFVVVVILELRWGITEH